MGRGRLKMELIANERARKTTFQKRRKGMMKKAYEFSTLCELDVCMIMYGPKLTDRPPELHTWPENPNEVDRIINKYKASTMRKPAKKTFDLSDLLTERKTKLHVDIYRARKEMYEAKYPTWDERMDNFSENQLEELLNDLDAKLESGKRTLLNKRNHQSADQYNHRKYHQVNHVMAEETSAPNKMLLLGGNPSNNNSVHVGEPSNQKQPYFYMQDRVEDKKSMSSLSSNMSDILQPFPVSFDHHHHQPPHHQTQRLQLDNPDQYLNNLIAGSNSGQTAMWMLMESKYMFSAAGASTSSSSQMPLDGYQYHNNFNDPMIQYSTLEKNMNMNMLMLNSNVNPPSSSSMSQYHTRLMQPAAVPYMQYPLMPPSISSHQVHQMHASQEKDNDQSYEDVINQFWS